VSWMRAAAVALAALLAAAPAVAQVSALAPEAPEPQRHGDLFPPQDLGLLEAPDRNV